MADSARAARGVSTPRRPQASPLFRLVSDHLHCLQTVYDERFTREYGPWRPVVAQVADKFLACAVLDHGFARIRCDACAHEYLLAFSCKCRYFCPSCHAKRLAICEVDPLACPPSHGPATPLGRGRQSHHQLKTVPAGIAPPTKPAVLTAPRGTPEAHRRGGWRAVGARPVGDRVVSSTYPNRNSYRVRSTAQDQALLRLLGGEGGATLAREVHKATHRSGRVDDPH